MSELKKRIISQIELTGPVSVADYMARCLFDPELGYYTRREPFGREGDFTTAPEVSQMFGELLAAWLFAAWQAANAPVPVTMAEIGPGRGTMMKDMLRTFRLLDHAFYDAADFVLIEASQRLSDIQRKALKDANCKLSWISDPGDLAPCPLLIVGNELFDALPVHQYVKHEGLWHERLVTVTTAGDLGFALGAGRIDPSQLPPPPADMPDGTVFEHAPQRVALMQVLCGHISRHGGAAIFADYGSQAGYGDTLQAVRSHGYDDVFANPGEADLTSHVDFGSLANVAKANDLECRLSTQGDFLLEMGLLERAGLLGAGATNETQSRLQSEVDRLAGSDQMGELFKIITVNGPQISNPPYL